MPVFTCTCQKRPKEALTPKTVVQKQSQRDNKKPTTTATTNNNNKANKTKKYMIPFYFAIAFLSLSFPYVVSFL
jgi:hypothetical protein